MTKEEFIEIRSRYKTDLECIREEHFNKDKFYEWKVEFGLSKRSKKDKERKKELQELSPDEFLKIREQYSSNEECAKALNLGKSAYYKIKKTLGLNMKYDHSEIKENEFLELYNQGLNDRQIAEELGTNGKRICALRTKLNLPNNTHKDLVFTDEQYQIFIGGLLGDSSLTVTKNCPNAYFSFAHSLKQEQYAKWKWEKMENLCHKPCYCTEHDKRFDKDYKSICVKSYTNELFTRYLDKFYYVENGKRIKYINEEIINSLEPLGIAIWFMDDGYKEDYGYCLSTNCFSEKDLNIIIKFFLDKYGILPTIHKNRVLYIGSKYKDKFTKIVQPYIHPELAYKLHKSPE